MVVVRGDFFINLFSTQYSVLSTQYSVLSPWVARADFFKCDDIGDLLMETGY